MDISVKSLRKSDFNSAREYAIVGMHLSRYTKSKLELYLYSKYFWYSEISKASLALGAYANDKLVGVLLVCMVNAPKVFKSLWYKVYVKIATIVMDIGYRDAHGVYVDINKELLETFKRNNEVDGELNFFAVDPNIKGKGIGTLLLNELEKLEKGKRIYLYTDSGASYQFYPRRGFDEVGRKDIYIKINGNELPLTCFLFSKIL
jgi:GNAT superfamily N-acetyltransferase